jgi:DNA-directed RNA polymerase subunit RPC12/RpoP
MVRLPKNWDLSIIRVGNIIFVIFADSFPPPERMLLLHMGVLESIKNLIGGEERTFEYVCQNCNTEFKSQKAKMSDVDCPECHSTKIRSATMAQQ